MSAARPGILLIGNYPPPYGGVPRHLEDLAPFLARQGWDVHVLSGGTAPDRTDQGVAVYRDRRGKLLRRLGTLRFLGHALATGRARAALAAARLLPPAAWAAVMTRVSLAAGIIARRDIRVISAYNLLSGAPVGAIAAEMFAIPLVVTNLGEIYSHRAEVQQVLPMVRRITETAAVLTSLTRHCAESYRELGLTVPVRVLHYGIDRGRFAGARGDTTIRRRYGIPADADVLLFVGRLVADMGVRVLLEAVPNLLEARADLHVLVAGAAGALQGEAESMAQGHPGRMYVAVDVSDQDLPRFYAASTLVVAPTVGARACGSLAAGEAMAAGKPVVAAGVGGIPEYVRDGETGVLVPPADAGALARAVVALLDDRPRLLAMGQQGAERVATLFDAERTSAALERMFRATAGL